MIRDRYPWPGDCSSPPIAPSPQSLLRPFHLWPYGSPFMSLGNLFGQRRVCLWTREHFGAERGKKRGTAVGLVSIMGWNTKRMQTWNNTTLDRVFRCGIPLSFPSHRFSLHIAVPVVSYVYPLALIIFAAGPVPKGGTWNLRQCRKSPCISTGSRQSLLFAMIHLEKNPRCNLGTINIYRAIIFVVYLTT